MSTPMSYALDGRRALVTGASGGIGGALAVKLAEAGANLILTYSNHRDDAEEVATRITQLGRTADIVQTDLAATNAGRHLIDTVTANIGPIDVLVANAGVGQQASWDEVTDDLWARTFAVNVTATWQMTQAVIPGMVARSFGRVLYVSSIAALNGGIVGAHYAASKAALHGLMHHMAARVAHAGITVNCIAPALISGTRIMPDSADNKLPASIPVGRLGEPDDIASMAIAMLINSYLTNKVITVDGGLYPA
jgi:3-oxoacyl-[acyl-carrier protein] reductase